MSLLQGTNVKSHHHLTTLSPRGRNPLMESSTWWKNWRLTL